MSKVALLHALTSHPGPSGCGTSIGAINVAGSEAGLSPDPEAGPSPSSAGTLPLGPAIE